MLLSSSDILNSRSESEASLAILAWQMELIDANIEFIDVLCDLFDTIAKQQALIERIWPIGQPWVVVAYEPAFIEEAWIVQVNVEVLGGHAGEILELKASFDIDEVREESDLVICLERNVSMLLVHIAWVLVEEKVPINMFYRQSLIWFVKINRILGLMCHTTAQVFLPEQIWDFDDTMGGKMTEFLLTVNLSLKHFYQDSNIIHHDLLEGHFEEQKLGMSCLLMPTTASHTKLLSLWQSFVIIWHELEADRVIVGQRIGRDIQLEIDE